MIHIKQIVIPSFGRTEVPFTPEPGWTDAHGIWALAHRDSEPPPGAPPGPPPTGYVEVKGIRAGAVVVFPDGTGIIGVGNDTNAAATVDLVIGYRG